MVKGLCVQRLSDGGRFTLAACWPVGSNTTVLVALASELVDRPFEKQLNAFPMFDQKGVGGGKVGGGSRCSGFFFLLLLKTSLGVP